MQVYPEHLADNLQRGLRGVYLLFGTDALLKIEAQQQIENCAKKQGFDEIHRFSIDGQFSWQTLFDCCQSLSLFSSRQLIMLTLPEDGLSAPQTQKIKELTSLLNPDVLLILSGPRLTKKQESTQWFSALNKQGIYVPCITPDSKQLPQFIVRRCQALGLTPEPDAIALLAYWHEGNLLALAQSLTKLQLLFPAGTVTASQVENALSSQQHFTPFQFIDALIEAKPKRSIRILRQLEAEGVEITLLLRLMQKELVLLYNLQEGYQSGANLASLFEQHRIWQQKRPAYSQALHRLPLPDLAALLAQLAQIEVQVKTDYNSQPWQQLNRLCLCFCGIKM